MTDTILSMFDNPYYAKLACQNKDRYREADPFPHAYFDNFLPTMFANYIAAMYPRPTNGRWRSAEWEAIDRGTHETSTGWTVHINENAHRYFMGDVTAMPAPLAQLAAAVNSRSFLLFLEALTGIHHLVPDPYFIGGGCMAAGRDDYLKMHVDFNWHYNLHLYRRCNALFYLTPSWQDEWGGALQLAKGDDAVAASIMPKFNRLIVFSTTNESYHGQPVPLKVPEGLYRNVFSAFYYTTLKGDEDIADPHLTRYRQETPYTAGPLKAYKETGGM